MVSKTAKKSAAVAHFCRHAEATAAAGDVTAADGVVGAGVFAVAVVLPHEQRGNLQHHGEVHGFEHGALVAAAVATEGDGDRAIAAVAAGDGGAYRERLAAAHDAVGTDHALVEVRDVHGAALALAGPPLFAVNFFHHFNDIDAFRNAVAVATVRTGAAGVRKSVV